MYDYLVEHESPVYNHFLCKRWQGGKEGKKMKTTIERDIAKVTFRIHSCSMV